MDTTLWLIVVLVLVVLAASRTGARENNAGRFGRLERKLDLILTHLGLDPKEDANLQIVELMKAGRKIEAIKLYREQSGVGLKDAKDYVESL
jgi:ribosomal protein L7/L12